MKLANTRYCIKSFYFFIPTQTARLPFGVFSTRICASNRSANAGTWEIIPTMQSWPESCCNSRMAFSSAVSSSDPKPSSMNMAWICTQPLCCCTASESPNASDNDAKKVSPPESVFTSRAVPVYWSNTSKFKPEERLRRSSYFRRINWYRPLESWYNFWFACSKILVK